MCLLHFLDFGENSDLKCSKKQEALLMEWVAVIVLERGSQSNLSVLLFESRRHDWTRLYHDRCRQSLVVVVVVVETKHERTHW